MSLPRDRLHAITLSGIRDGFACSGVYLELEFSLSAIVRRFYHKYLKTQYISFTIPLDSSYKPLLQEDFTLSAILEKPPDTVGELKVPKFVCPTCLL